MWALFGVLLIDVSDDWFTIGVEVEPEIAELVASGKSVGCTLQLARHRKYITNKETVFSAIAANVRPSPFLTKIQACFLRDHGHRMPLPPTLP